VKLVGGWDWFNLDALDGLGDEIMEIFSRSTEVDIDHASAIAAAVDKRCSKLPIQLI